MKIEIINENLHLNIYTKMYSACVSWIRSNDNFLPLVALFLIIAIIVSLHYYVP